MQDQVKAMKDKWVGLVAGGGTAREGQMRS